MIANTIRARDLDDVDGDVDRRAAVDAAVGDVGDAEREDDAEQIHQERAVVDAAEGVREQVAREVPDKQRRDADHHPG